MTAALLEALCASALLVPVAAAKDLGGGSRLPPASDDAGLDFVGTLQEGGKTALLAFADIQALSAWGSEHAFVAVQAPDLCGLVLERGLDALVLDVAGPVRVSLGPQALRRCATRSARTAASS